MGRDLIIQISWRIRPLALFTKTDVYLSSIPLKGPRWLAPFQRMMTNSMLPEGGLSARKLGDYAGISTEVGMGSRWQWRAHRV